MKSYIEVKRVYDLTELNSMLYDIPADDVIRIDPEGSAYLVQYKVREGCGESCTCGGNCKCDGTHDATPTSDPFYIDLAEKLVAHIGTDDISDSQLSTVNDVSEHFVDKMMKCCNIFGVEEAVALLELLHKYNIHTYEALSHILSSSFGVAWIDSSDSICFTEKSE